jgi:hypothetical protein
VDVSNVTTHGTTSTSSTVVGTLGAAAGQATTANYVRSSRSSSRRAGGVTSSSPPEAQINSTEPPAGHLLCCIGWRSISATHTPGGCALVVETACDTWAAEHADCHFWCWPLGSMKRCNLSRCNPRCCKLLRAVQLWAGLVMLVTGGAPGGSTTLQQCLAVSPSSSAACGWMLAVCVNQTWWQPVVQYTGAVHWSSTLEQYIGAVQWSLSPEGLGSRSQATPEATW